MTEICWKVLGARSSLFAALALSACSSGPDKAENLSNGVQTDASVDEDTGSDRNMGAAACTGNTPVVTGTLRTEVSDVGFSLVAIETIHRRDVDPAEGGCLAEVHITLRTMEEPSVRVDPVGCVLELVAREQRDDRRLAIVEARFEADSLCPGFLDAYEGVYDMGGNCDPHYCRAPIGYVTIPALRLEPTDAEEVCADGTFTVDFNGLLFAESSSDSRTLEFQPSTLTITGDVTSLGQTGAYCPCVVGTTFMCHRETGDLHLRASCTTGVDALGPFVQACPSDTTCVETAGNAECVSNP